MEIKDNEKQKKDLGLYIHIPFCQKKCDYCDFLSAPADCDTKEKYVQALITEILSYKELASEYLVRTIFIGGGTPSSIEGKCITDIMDAIREVFIISGESSQQNKKQDFINADANFGSVIKDTVEITIEVNPGTLSREKLKLYKEAGINRLSFGLQSADNKELKLLGRIHSFEDFITNYQLAREEGFHNISIDLMSGLPGQTLEDWLSTLNKVVALNPEHISAYSLILEEGTPFYERYREEDQDENLDREIYSQTKTYLSHHGYYRYEISNYAKPGYESRHNSSYWRRTEYLGIGLGASSLLHNVRFHNEEDLTKYMKLSADCHDIRRNVEELLMKEQMEEFMFLGLRMSDGIKKEEFKKLFGRSIDTVYGDVISKSIQEELLYMDESHLYLTEKGIDLSNMVLARFLLED